MRLIELRVMDRNDYGHVLIAFGLTLIDFYFVIYKDRSCWMARVGNWNGWGHDWNITNAS